MNKTTTLISVLLLVISGCASTPPKVSPLTDQMIQSQKGDFEGLFNRWIAPHLNGQGLIIMSDKDEKAATEKAIVNDFSRFCEAMGARPGSSSQRYGTKTICTDSNGDFLGEFNTTRYTNGVEVSVDSLEIRKNKQAQAVADTVAANKQQYQSLAPAMLSNLSLDDLSSKISKFEFNDPELFIPKAKERLAVLMVERKKQQQLEQERKALERERIAQQRAIDEAARRARLENKQIGDQICHISDSSVKQSTGYIVYGQTQYQTVNGKTRIVGFVERVAGKKIQIRISGINFTGPGVSEALESYTNFNGGSTLNINSLIWDDLYEWEGC